jgi:hypothetical protein
MHKTKYEEFQEKKSLPTASHRITTHTHIHNPMKKCAPTVFLSEQTLCIEAKNGTTAPNFSAANISIIL